MSQAGGWYDATYGRFALDARARVRQETYGEDPFLTARMGVAFVKGLQGDDPQYFYQMSVPGYAYGVNALLYGLTN